MRRVLVGLCVLIATVIAVLGSTPAMAQDQGSIVEPYESAALPQRFRAARAPSQLVAGSGTIIGVGGVTAAVGLVGVIASLVRAEQGDGLGGLVWGFIFSTVMVTGLVITVVGVEKHARERGWRLRLSPLGALLQATF